MYHNGFTHVFAQHTDDDDVLTESCPQQYVCSSLGNKHLYLWEISDLKQWIFWFMLQAIQCYLTGAAAPGIDVPSWCTVLVCPFLQPIGLVDYESLKKSICRVRLFSSQFLKQLWTERQHPLVTIYSIYWWPSGKRSTNVNRSDSASSPISKCALWLKCLRPFWKNVTKEWKTVLSSVWITRSSQLCSFFLPGITVPTDVAMVSYGNGLKVKVKFSHTRYRALGPEPIPVYRQSARRWREVNHAIYPAVVCRCFLPGLRVPS